MSFLPFCYLHSSYIGSSTLPFSWLNTPVSIKSVNLPEVGQQNYIMVAVFNFSCFSFIKR